MEVSSSEEIAAVQSTVHVSAPSSAHDQAHADTMDLHAILIAIQAQLSTLGPLQAQINELALDVNRLKGSPHRSLHRSHTPSPTGSDSGFLGLQRRSHHGSPSSAGQAQHSPSAVVSVATAQTTPSVAAVLPATAAPTVSTTAVGAAVQARQERLRRHVNVLRRLLTLLSDPDRTLPIIPIRLGTSTRVYRALWDSGSQGDFVHPRVVEEARLATSGSQSPISVTLGDNKTQRFFDQTVPDLHFSLTLQPSDSTQTPRRYHSSAYFDVLETGYDFILGNPWSRRFRSTEAEWATETLVLKTKCGQTHRVPFIGTTGDTPPDLLPQDPRPSGSHPNIAFTSPRQFVHFIRQEDVTFYSVNVMDLLRYDPLCLEVELISLESDPPNPPSIFAAPISTSTRQPADTPSTSQAPAPSTVESTHTSRADADAEELTRFTADLESALRDLIREYRDVFPPYFSYSGIPPERGVEHSIQLVPDYRVHHQAPYRLSIPEATELKRHLEELLRLGFIKPSNSPWDAPVLFARKADETLRLCIDYRGLNRYTVKNNYPMPRADELFDHLAGNRFFTKIDLRRGYHQIRVATEDQSKTAFRSRFGHNEFTVMPFGLTNAPATFQTTMNDIFRDILEEYVLVYLDDILVYSRTLEDHLRHLRDVLQRLRKHGLYAKLSKCRFAQRKVNFLGHHVSDQGLHMDDTKITAIAEWPVPTSAKQLRSFLGLTSYYSNFIQGYASFTTQPIKGETNRVADALSRRPDHNQEPIHLAAISITTVDQSVIDVYRTQYLHCPDYRVIHATLRSGKTVPSYSLGENGLVYWHGRSDQLEPHICVPSTGQLRVQAVAEFHDQAAAGHMGFHKTLARVCRLYVWPKSKDFVKAYSQECPTCQEDNSANHLPYGLHQPLPIPEGRWKSISMDFIGPLRPPTERGHDAILVVVDRFTKRARFVSCRYRISAHEVADIVFDRVVRDHGLPQSIISDRDPRFTSTFWRRLPEVYGSQLRFSSSYHPQTDGQTEVTNKTLGNFLRKFIRDDQQWDLHLAHTEIAYNHAVPPTTGRSPFYCDLVYHPRVPADFLRPSRLRPDTRCPAFDDWIAHMVAIMKRAHESLADSQTRMAA
ncbi:hypothetical protein CBR_g49087 [Chara braunii]|uniref:Reverse transcriptase n=1 Tax=Chara braunii TaxID=69332 RepID=A0A388K4N1_CHABU|nr:hypothetical protein CBR_g49087 [Chara braunii]|eukprot:GBG65018.1 hypothetical protein CBR_g49087 [Chara braunii]